MWHATFADPHSCLLWLVQAPGAQATACCKLGVLYHQQGRLEQAVSYFERFYELARSLGEYMQQRFWQEAEAAHLLAHVKHLLATELGQCGSAAATVRKCPVSLLCGDC